MTRALGPEPGEALSRPARLLETAALGCILAVLAARPFVTEMPFRSAQLVLAKGSPREIAKPPAELLGVSFDMALLAAAALWALAQASRRRWHVTGCVWAGAIAALAGWSMVSALGAVEKRSALDGWLDQVAILAAGFVTMQLARRRSNRALVLAVLAALAVTMAAKGYEQAGYEIPERIADFRADPAKVFARQGLPPDSPQARMLVRRITDRATTGYFGLANVYASLLVVLLAAAGGLATQKVLSARLSRRTEPRLRPGEVHLPTVAAAVSTLLAAAVVPALLLTESKGGIAAAAVAVVAAAGVMLWRRSCALHRRKLLAAWAAALLIGIGATTAVGLARGSLPSRSMQVRWEYWIGASRIIARHPLWGVGPGNFGQAYLAYRLPAAAEGTKTAHNVLFDAASVYGLPGAAVYLAMLVWVFAALTRPARQEDARAPEGSAAGTIRWCALLTAVVFAARLVWLGDSEPLLVMLEAGMPALVFAVSLLAASWAGRALAPGNLWGPLARIALVAGLAGFALHNLVSYTLWSPATATTFWVAAGAAAGGAEIRTRQPRRILAVATASLWLLALAAAGVWLWGPVERRSALLRAAQWDYSGDHLVGALANVRAAAATDRADGFAPADLARIYLEEVEQSPQSLSREDLAEARHYAALAYRRSPTALNAILLARALWVEGADRPAALDMAKKAVALDPMNHRQRWEYAEMLQAAGRLREAMDQVREIRRIEQALPRDTDLRLTSRELDGIERLEQSLRRKLSATTSAEAG